MRPVAVPPEGWCAIPMPSLGAHATHNVLLKFYILSCQRGCSTDRLGANRQAGNQLLHLSEPQGPSLLLAGGRYCWLFCKTPIRCSEKKAPLNYQLWSHHRIMRRVVSVRSEATRPNRENSGHIWATSCYRTATWSYIALIRWRADCAHDRDVTFDVVVHTTFASFFHGGQVKAELSADNALNKTFQFEPIWHGMNHICSGAQRMNEEGHFPAGQWQSELPLKSLFSR